MKFSNLNQMNKYPWVVTIVNNFGFPRPEDCGGTLVASKYVISAAHCLKYNIPSEIKAGLLFLK